MERRGDLPEQEKDENIAAQEEELEALEAIYGEDCEVISRGSTASCPEVKNVMIPINYVRKYKELFNMYIHT